MGAHGHFTQKRRRGIHTDRLREATARARRVEHLPLTRMMKAEVIATAIIPMGLHGASIALLPKDELDAILALEMARGPGREG